MVDQNIPLQESLAPEVAALIDLAQLAQHTGSTTIENLHTIADKLLARLLVLCSAQRGAVFLGVDERLQSELHATHHKIFRALALHGVDEEAAHALLSPHEIEELPSDDHSPLLVRQPLDALLVLGWTVENDGECASAVEKGHHLLPYVIDAMGAVIVGILQVERIHELEATRIRDSLREMELLKAELLGTVSHELRSPLASIKGYAA